MPNFNRIFVIGNLTRDPQLSYTPNQVAIVDFGFAVNRKWTDNKGESRDEVCFVDCRAFGRLAENINKYLHRGNPLFIEGRLAFEQWTAQDGSKRSRHRIIVQSFQFVNTGGGEQASQGNQDQEDENYQYPDDDIPF